jgi:hypothetical protein
MDTQGSERRFAPLATLAKKLAVRRTSDSRDRRSTTPVIAETSFALGTQRGGI